MLYIILWLVGFSAIWLGLRAKDEIHRLAWSCVSCLDLAWGYLTSPTSIQCLSLLVLLGYGSTSILKIR